MLKTLLLRAALGAAFVLPATKAVAEVYRAEGVASLEQGALAARHAAIDDALRQIAMTHQGGMQASSQVRNGVAAAESMLLGAARLPGKSKVLSERRQDGLLIVTVEHDTDTDAGSAAEEAVADGGAAACAAGGLPPGRFLARRVLTSYFQVDRPQDASDLGSIATWFPAELSRRLNGQRNVQALDAGTVSLFPGGRVQEPWQIADAVREVGRRENIQFVLAGRIVDSAVVRNEPRPIVLGSNGEARQGAYYQGPFAGLLGLSLRKVPTARRFVVEYWLYDALSGGIVQRDSVQRVAHGNVDPRSMRLFDAGTLAESDYGKAVSAVLDELATAATRAVQCLPFATRVVRVDGERIYLAAGGLDGLAVRDRLLLYKPTPATEIRRSDGQVLGVPEQLQGDVEIEQVQPRFAVARLRTPGGKVAVGDWVRYPVRPN